ncbi:MAG: acyl-CoA desaturase [Bauldia sp.]|nr:acyl-CoA desaturase [Bauldia sp.]
MPSRNLVATERVKPLPETSATDGRIVWAPVKSLWISTMAVAGVVGGAFCFSWSAVAVFVVLTAVTICAGHSVGMHRLLIHRSFKTHLWLERLLVYLGTLVGMAGPFGMIRAHDMRDWHQRQTECPPHPSHGAGFWMDAYWQLHCVFRLDSPPAFRIEGEAHKDRFYRAIEATWMAQQLPPAVVLLAIGGWGWVFWGICLRVAVSLTGHWMVGHFAHRTGHQGWRVEGIPVQGYNLPGLGLITFGENWHGNHHAFPHSARLGVEPGQFDPGYILVRSLARLGLAWDIQLPQSRTQRDGLVRVYPEVPLRNRLPGQSASARLACPLHWRAG